MRFFVAFLIAIGLIVLVFVLFLTGGSTKKGTKPAAADLSSYASTTAIMKVTIDGTVTADQNHRAIQLTVGRDQNTLEILQGYQGSVINQTTYPNNQNAYNVFLHALGLANFTAKRNTSLSDERGVCPLGFRYIFEIIDGAQSKQRLWATSCGSQGTFGGSLQLNLSLFQRQIPDYGKLTNNVNLSGSS